MEHNDERNDLLNTNLLPTKEHSNSTAQSEMQKPTANVNEEIMKDEREVVKRLKRKNCTAAQSGRSPKRVKRSESYFLNLASNGEKLLRKTKMNKGIGAEKIVDWCMSHKYQIVLPDRMDSSAWSKVIDKGTFPLSIFFSNAGHFSTIHLVSKETALIIDTIPNYHAEIMKPVIEALRLCGVAVEDGTGDFVQAEGFECGLISCLLIEWINLDLLVGTISEWKERFAVWLTGITTDDLISINYDILNRK